MGTPAVTPDPYAAYGGSVASGGGADPYAAYGGAATSTKAGNKPPGWSLSSVLSGTDPAHQAIDQAAQTQPVDTGSVGGFAKSVANNLGAGAVRIFSPLVHPGNTLMGIGKTIAAAQGDQGAQYDLGNSMVRPFVQNPSGEAVAAIPQAALAFAGGGRAATAMDEASAATGAGGAAGTAKAAISGQVAKYIPALADGPPESLLTRAIKPGKNNANWTSDLKTAIPLMKSAEAQVGPIAGETAIDTALQANAAAKKSLWQQYMARLGPTGAQGQMVDGNAVADAMMSSIDKRMALQNPGLTAKIQQAADIYRKPLSVQDAEDFIQSNNRELVGYYAKNKLSQQAAMADPEVAARVAEGDALRQALYSKLDDVSGPGSAQLKKAYGALTNVQKELTGRQIVYARQAPVSLGEQLGYLPAMGKIATGNILGGMKDIAIRRFLSEVNDTNSMIERAFAKAPQAQPFPQPNFRPPMTTNLLPGPGQSSAAIPLMAPDPGMSVGERSAAMMQYLRQRQQLALPAQTTPIQLPARFMQK